ncbi:MULTISPECIES: exodeoxyribonuclease III [Methylomonas]|uniref:DNA-(Apurinic or apyrimidinic site) lyase n=2 Tax=Methylomonas TaxID=416 RepID=A0A126T8E5_9GAMM|nr:MULTISPECIES: exodeoxyribonuclease III [Methylomonas]AMK78044.1 DNA-(apurinic or apyrimidinic site) lyase [Methylomonas denitrificans]OAI07658.1 DNA-(apurinic or apyrimidinic site) lyase [Methylomonas methanica]TCV85579.1 exodeoxyribonuclease-3 [Methylomonas methanica]
MLRIISANLNGIRSATRKGFYDWLDTQTPDFVCLQELKAQAGDMTAGMLTPNGLHGYFHYAEKKGYSGVGIYSKQPADNVIEGLGHADIDSEGRYLEVHVGNLAVISLYLPSGSSSEERQTVKYSVMERFYPHLAELKASGREVVICGDWNIAHKEADLKNWRGNQKNSGFLPAERAWMTQVYDELGWVDVYRSLHPDATDACYTWWSNRGQAWAKNVGWRIDYQVATPGIAGRASATSIFKELRFSDHAPLIVDYDF